MGISIRLTDTATTEAHFSLRNLSGARPVESSVWSLNQSSLLFLPSPALLPSASISWLLNPK